MSDSRFEQVLGLAERNDAGCAEALAQFVDPELVGELMIAIYLSGTEAGRAALAPIYPRPYRRGYWQGCKRIFKLAEASFDVDPFCELAHAIDLAQPEWRRTQTHLYMQRRSYRHLKRVALERPESFLEHVERLLPRYDRGQGSVLLERLLRLTQLETAASSEHAVASFSPALENPFAVQPDDPAEGDDLLALDDEALVLTEPVEAEEAPSPPQAPAPWQGPIFAELWVQDPKRLVGLLETTRHERSAKALVRLLVQRVGERLLEVELEAFYRLLEHPVGAVWRFGLSQLAARARQELLHFDRLVPLFERAQAGGPDWSVIADLLFVLDDERAVEARAGLGPPLRQLLSHHASQAGIGPVVAFFRRHLSAELGPPLFNWAQAVDLLQGARPDVRELGRDVTYALADVVELEPHALQQLLTTTLVEDDPDGVHRLLTGTAPRPRGFRPPEAWTAKECVRCLNELPEPGFQAMRRALLHFEQDDGLEPELATELLGDESRRARELGRELLGAALERGALELLDLVDLLRTRHEDVVVWLQERLEEAAGGGRLPNEALYRMLDGTRRDVQGFARGLVEEHLARFEMAELIVFCAESPDATTADLGIQLYEQELGDQGFDLQALLPMFRILLYKVAAARREKDRLFGTLRRWACESEANAQLVIDVVGAFRRSEAQLDFSKAVSLMVEIGVRQPGVELPFTTRQVFGWTPSQESA